MHLVAMLILGILILQLFFCIFMAFRNQWVYKQRLNLINNKWESYPNYWTYNKMFLHFWIWDVEKMKDEE